MKKSLTFIFVLFVSFNLYSDPVMWSFAGSSSAATVQPAGVSAGNATFGDAIVGVTFVQKNTGGKAYQGQKWGESTAPEVGRYIEFCIQNVSGASFDVENFIFDESRSVKGPTTWDLTYIIGGTETTIVSSQSTSVADSWQNHNVPTNITVDDNVTICFRLYGYGAQHVPGTWTFDDVIISGTGAIPISLLDFDVNSQKSESLVTWSTLTETNNDYFLLEWSRDGKNFEEIVNLDGAGTSREKQDYKYIHTNPTKGINYYRLSQFDFDGRSEIFSIISIYLDIDIINMQIAPNRVERVLQINFNQEFGEGKIQIYNMEGRMIMSHELLKSMNELKIDVTNILPGQYFVRYIGNNRALINKFIKL